MKPLQVRRPLCVLFLAVLAGISLYFCLFGAGDTDPFASWNKQRMMFTGYVQGKEQRKNEDGSSDILLRIRTDGVVLGDGTTKPLKAGVLVYPEEGAVLPVTGQAVRVTGSVACFDGSSNPGAFHARRYYAIHGARFRLFDARVNETAGRRSVFSEALFRLRVFLAGVLDDTLDSGDAGVLKAMLLGDRSAMERDLKALYQSAGIAHLLAVSGLHFSIAGTLVYRLLQTLRLPQGIAAFVSIAIMVSYAVLCGMPTSAVRACAMFVLSRMAPRLGRTYDLLSALALAGLLMLLEQPLYALDGGFLLSYGAVMGLGILHPALRDAVCGPNGPMSGPNGPMRKRIREALLGSVSVTLATLPVLLCIYGTFSMYSVLINLLVIPLMSLVVPCGALVLAAGVLSRTAGAVCALPVHFLLAFYRWVCEQNRLLPFNTLYAGCPATWQVAVYYGLLACVVCSESLYGMLRTHRRKRLMNVSLIVLSVIALLFRIPPALQITFLDVGQGDGIVIRNGTHNYLIDGGSSSETDVGAYRILPYLKHEGIGRIDAVFISHEDTDHISGVLELFADMKNGGIRVDRLFLPDIGRTQEPAEDAADSYMRLVYAARRLGIPVTYLRKGQRLTQGNLVFTCLAPGTGRTGADRNAAGTDVSTWSANEHSMVLRMQYGSFSALFTGDIEGAGLVALNETLAALPEERRTFDVLKVAHHGSRLTTDETFLSLTGAKLAVISCGKNNRYGHPHEETLDRLSADSSRILTTAESGAVTVTVLRGGTSATVDRFLTPQDSVPPGP